MRDSVRHAPRNFTSNKKVEPLFDKLDIAAMILTAASALLLWVVILWAIESGGA